MTNVKDQGIDVVSGVMPKPVSPLPQGAMPMEMLNGILASRFGFNLPLQVVASGAGFYIGTAEDALPVSRESVEYYTTQGEAEQALLTGNWTQRQTV